MIVNHKDYRMLDQKRGYGVGFQMLNQASFDPEEVGMVMDLLGRRRQHFGDGVVAIDCGANIGAHTIEWARHMVGWGEVTAIEAQERIFYALAGNIAINNCFNARALYAAAGSTEGVMRIPRPDYNVPASFGSLELRKGAKNEFIGQAVDYSDKECQDVTVRTLDGLNLMRVDLIKIDVEGMELDVLEGAKEIIARDKPQMLIEVIKTDQVKLQALLVNAGYKLFPMGINLLAIHTSDPSVHEVKITTSVR
jgi:FkbM family methyltransferase